MKSIITRWIFLLTLNVLVTSQLYPSSDCPPGYLGCLDQELCVLKDGLCNGNSDCGDESDEVYCGACEEILEETGEIYYDVPIRPTKGIKTTSCWKIKVPSFKYLKLNITRLNLHGSTCNDASVTIYDEKFETVNKLCGKSSEEYVLERFDTTEIRYYGEPPPLFRAKDSFNIIFTITDVLCKRSDSIECTPNVCVSHEKKCDGVVDCSNAVDEHGCERGVIAVPNVNITLDKGIRWLKNERNAAWGWRDNTHRAVVAMYLAHGANFNGSNQEEDLTAKQLELQMTTAILRNETDPIPPTQLAMYINALLVICHDPRNFYGFNLVRILRDQVEFPLNSFQPLPYLALCNANETLTDDAVRKLITILDSSSEHGFLLDVQSLTVMALSCASKKGNFSSLRSKIDETTNMFKKEQNEDGSFGNIYTTALVIQAFLSSGKEEDRDWDLKAAIKFLKQKQNKVNGSFHDLLATSLILPILNAKSLVDIGNINCTENLKMPRDGNPVTNIELRFGQKISITYCLYIGNEKDQIHPITLRTPSNITVLDAMRLAAEADPKYRFEAQRSKGKLYVYKLSGLSNDPEDGKFWLLYTKSENETLKITSKSPDDISVNDKDEIFMWYRSASIE